MPPHPGGGHRPAAWPRGPAADRPPHAVARDCTRCSTRRSRARPIREIDGVEVVRRAALPPAPPTCSPPTASCSAPRPTSATCPGAQALLRPVYYPCLDDTVGLPVRPLRARQQRHRRRDPRRRDDHDRPGLAAGGRAGRGARPAGRRPARLRDSPPSPPRSCRPSGARGANVGLSGCEPPGAERSLRSDVGAERSSRSERRH